MNRAKVVMKPLATLLSTIILVIILLTLSSAVVLAATSISISISSGPPGTQVTVSGVEFGANEAGIMVAFDGSVMASSIVASGTGAWSTNFNIPASVSGAHIISAIGPSSGTLTVTFATTAVISLNKTSGTPGSSVTVTGAGFGASETGIRVTFDGTAVTTGTTASTAGAWSSTFTVPASPSGSHNISAYGSLTATVPVVTFSTTTGITLNRSSGTQGTSVTVTGSGFSDSETNIIITFDGNTVASGISASATGAWSGSFTVPASPAGSHNIGASGSVTTSVLTVTFKTSAGITLSKTSGAPGSSIAITGFGFGANETGINVTFDGNTVASGISANTIGAWNSNFTVPASASGSHNVGAYGSVTIAGTASNVNFTIGAGITVSKTSGTPGSSITITGSGFSANETGINVTFDGNPVTSGISANDSGAWSSTFVIPPLASGSHSIGAYGSISTATSVAKVSFTMGAAISLSKPNGAPGGTITVTGSGFVANETGISITFDGNPIVTGISANSSGTWTANMTIPSSAFGPHTISASGSMTQASTASQSGFNTAAGVVLSPATGYIGSTVSISGSGFAGNSQVRITYDNVEIQQGATTDANGNVSQSITIPTSKAGTHSIAVIDSQGNNVKVSFAISNTPPPVPKQKSPKDNGTLGLTGNITPTFQWSSVTDPNGVSYELQIDTNSDFSDPVLDKLAIPANHYTLKDSEALPRGTYYWRVKAINNASIESPWSEPWTLKSGLMAPWMLSLVILLGLAAIGAGVYFGIIRTMLRKREAITVSEVEMPVITPGQWQALESPEESSKEHQTSKKLALPEVSKSSKTLSTEDQARIKVIVEFAQSIPLAEPDYNVKWLVNLVENQTQTQMSLQVYEQILKGELQLHYEPSWTRHPIYKDLTNLLQKQPILQKLDTYIIDVERCASEAMSLIQQISRESASEFPPDFLTRGGWGFLAAVYTDAINWYAGKSLRDPAERDYVLENVNDGKESAQRWLSGEATTLFGGHLILAQDEKDALELRAVHLKLRRTWRNSEKARQVSSAITQLQLKRNELLNAFSQFGRAK